MMQNYTIVCMTCELPGHTQITKHIITDNLTKNNAAHSMYINIFFELEEMIEIVEQKHLDTWFKEWKTMRGTKDYIKLHNPSNLKHPYSIHLPNRQLEIIVNRLRLGTNNLNYYRHKVGRNDSPLCTTCAKEETTIHFLTECSKHKNLIDKIKKLIKKDNLESVLSEILNSKETLHTIATYIKTNNISF